MSGRSRPAPKRRPAKRRPPARKRRKKGSAKAKRSRSAVPLLIGVALIGAIAFGVSRIDFGETIRSVTLPLEHEDVIREEATDEDIAQVDGTQVTLPETDPALLAAVIYAESRFRDQTSSAGARGLMQITPDTADTIEAISGGETFVFDDLANPELNIRYGSFYLRYLLHLFDGNEVAALAGYNGGPGNASDWGGSSMDQDDIAFPETREYVEIVLEKRAEYRNNYAKELGI